MAPAASGNSLLPHPGRGSREGAARAPRPLSAVGIWWRSKRVGRGRCPLSRAWGVGAWERTSSPPSFNFLNFLWVAAPQPEGWHGCPPSRGRGGGGQVNASSRSFTRTPHPPTPPRCGRLRQPARAVWLSELRVCPEAGKKKKRKTKIGKSGAASAGTASGGTSRPPAGSENLRWCGGEGSRRSAPLLPAGSCAASLVAPEPRGQKSRRHRFRPPCREGSLAELPRRWGGQRALPGHWLQRGTLLGPALHATGKVCGLGGLRCRSKKLTSV